jgi:hypothetical protein
MIMGFHKMGLTIIRTVLRFDKIAGSDFERTKCDPKGGGPMFYFIGPEVILPAQPS